MDRPLWVPHRRRLLASARGSILEIGAGTGLNLPHYPDGVREITTVDPNPGMHRRLQRRSRATGVGIDHHRARGEALPFSSESFDCVVSAVTLCSMTDVSVTLAECYRVLKPGGRFLFLEHGVSPDAGVRKWQQRLNGLQQIVADGCTLVLDIRQLISKQPYDQLELDSFYLPGVPRTHGYLYLGIATK